MTKLLSAAALVGALIAFSPIGAQAFPAAPPASESEIVLVAQGCGPGWARDRFGICRPMRGPIVRPRACWWVQTVYGPRRVCR
jgi:hypothetical protein